MIQPSKLKSILRYPGAKWRLADRVVDELPTHDIYLEPFFGSGAVFFRKPRARVETINDVDHRVTNLFRVVRDQAEELADAVSLTPYARIEYDDSYGPETGDPIEDARRFLVRVWMAHGGKFGCRCAWRNDIRGRRRGTAMPGEWRNLPDRIMAVVDRLRDAHIECRNAVDVISAAADPNVLIYADPPYLRGVLYERSARYYSHDLTDEDHHELLDVLGSHPGPVLLSGYRSDLYDHCLTDWRRIDFEATAYRNAARTECLWVNPVAAERFDRQLALEIPA